MQTLNVGGIRNLMDVAATVTNCESRGRGLGADRNGNVSIHAFKFSGEPEIGKLLQGSLDLDCAPKAGFLKDGIGAQRRLLLLKHMQNPLLVWCQASHNIHYP